MVYCSSRCLAAFKHYGSLPKTALAAEELAWTLHDALNQAAALSRFLWPDRGELHVIRGEALCEILDIDDDSPLKLRSLRNRLEHFDQDLDKFLLEDVAGHFLPVPIVGDSRIAEEPTAMIFKLIDPEREIFVVLNKQFAFGPIRAEVEKVHRNLQRIL